MLYLKSSFYLPARHTSFSQESYEAQSLAVDKNRGEKTAMAIGRLKTVGEIKTIVGKRRRRGQLDFPQTCI